MTNFVSKPTLFTILVLIGILNFSYAQTQTFFGAPSGTSSTDTTTPKQVMSPDDFKNAVTQRAQQVKSGLNQQSDQFMKTPTATTTPPATVTPSPEIITPAPTTPAPAETQPPTTQAPTSLPPMQTPAPPSSAPIVMPDASKQSNVYTGFPAKSNESGSSTTKPSGSSGSWNIKY